MHGEEMMAAILIPLTFCALIFGIVYLIKRENLAMIEKGMNPKEFANRPAPYKNLKWGLLLMGAGAGLFLAYVLDTFAFQNNWTETFDGNTYHHHDGNPAIYFALIAIGGGLGLFGSYKMEKKWWDENKEKQ